MSAASDEDVASNDDFTDDFTDRDGILNKNVESNIDNGVNEDDDYN